MSDKKIYYTDQQIKGWCHNIMRDMQQDRWEPDYIVGLSRGGLIPAVMISHYLNVPMHALEVSLRDGGDCVSNLSMAVDAYGHGMPRPKRILIVDDINDSGATLNWIKSDWQDSCFPNNTTLWNQVWHDTVRFAVMINNEASTFKTVDYVGKTINKQDNPEWCVFPWEAWWA